MPYSGPGDDSLPAYVQELSEEDRAQWVEVFNSAYSRCIADDGETTECESSAFAQANGVVIKKENRRMGAVAKLWEKIKALFEGELADEPDDEPAEEDEAERARRATRAIALGQVWDQVYSGLDEADRLAGQWSWPVDIFEDGGMLYVIVAREGRLYRVPLAIAGTMVTLGDWQEVETQHVPVGGPETRTAVLRQADGRYRWLSISCTSALNRVGEIDSRELFDRFIERAAAEGYPQRDFYHLEDAAPVGQCDTLVRDGNCLITSGVYYDTPIGQAVRRATEAGVMAGDSISYLPVGGPELVEVAADVRIPVYRDGILRWIASLPEGEAASLFTATTVREVQRMSDRLRQALDALKEFGLTDADIDPIVAKVDGTNRAIDERDIITRTAPPTPSPDPEPEPEAARAPAGVEWALDDAALEAMVRTLAESEVFRTLQAGMETVRQAVEALQSRTAELAGQAEALGQDVAGRLEALEKSDDDKRREWLADLPARQQVVVTYRPREAHEEEAPESMAAVADTTLAKIPKLGH